jgi:hypothetical protein
MNCDATFPDGKRAVLRAGTAGAVLPLGLDEPFNIAAIVFCCAFRISAGQQVRVSTRKSHGTKGLMSRLNPLPMSLLVKRL